MGFPRRRLRSRYVKPLNKYIVSMRDVGSTEPKFVYWQKNIEAYFAEDALFMAINNDCMYRENIYFKDDRYVFDVVCVLEFEEQKEIKY